MELKAHEKLKLCDKELTNDSVEEDLSQHDITKFYAVGRTFTKVSFKQSVLNLCYFRNCTFVGCNFTGAAIKECNFRGASFDNCIFDYCTFEKTQLEADFLNRCLPTGENLARDLVRSLRVNFSQIGDYEAVNAAIKIEVQLTRQHHYNAAYSKIGYYRSKYKGGKRFLNGLLHAKWKFFDLLWGNGESVPRIAAVGLITIIVFTFAHPYATTLGGYIQALPRVGANFWGVKVTENLSNMCFALITAIRFILFGLFMAVLVKRLARR